MVKMAPNESFLFNAVAETTPLFGNAKMNLGRDTKQQTVPVNNKSNSTVKKNTAGVNTLHSNGPLSINIG